MALPKMRLSLSASSSVFSLRSQVAVIYFIVIAWETGTHLYYLVVVFFHQTEVFVNVEVPRFHAKQQPPLRNSGPTLASHCSLPLPLLEFISHFLLLHFDKEILTTELNCEVFQKGSSAAEMVELGGSHLAQTVSPQHWEAQPLVKTGNRAQRTTTPKHKIG